MSGGVCCARSIWANESNQHQITLACMRPKLYPCCIITLASRPRGRVAKENLKKIKIDYGIECAFALDIASTRVNAHQRQPNRFELPIRLTCRRLSLSNRIISNQLPLTSHAISDWSMLSHSSFSIGKRLTWKSTYGPQWGSANHFTFSWFNHASRRTFISAEWGKFYGTPSNTMPKIKVNSIDSICLLLASSDRFTFFSSFVAFIELVEWSVLQIHCMKYSLFYCYDGSVVQFP